MTELSADGFTLKGWHVAAMVVGFFAVVVAVDAAFMVAAYCTAPGEVSATPFEDGVAYNRRLAREAAQARLGWSATLAQDGGAVRLTVRDRDQRPVEGLAFTAQLERPATEQGRLSPIVRAQGRGVYALDLASLHGGWDLSLTGRDRDGHRFDVEDRIVLP